MEIATLITTLVGQLLLILKGTSLGPKGDAIVESLNLLGSVLAKSEQASAELVQLKAQVQAMVAEGRDPTPEEWGTLRDWARHNHNVLNPIPDGMEPQETDA